MATTVAEDYGKLTFDLLKTVVRQILLQLQGFLSSSQVAWSRQHTPHCILHSHVQNTAIFGLYLPETATWQSNHRVEKV